MSNATHPKPRQTTFHVVPPRQRVALRAGGRWWATLIILVAAAGVVGASNLAVQQKSDTASIYAERFIVGENFELTDSRIWVTKAARAAVGVRGSAVELASAAASEAHPALLPDQWVYSVTLKESSAASVGPGEYTADLFVDERSVGSVFLSQTVDEPAVESVKLSFPIGADLGTSSLYYVVVKPYVQTGPTITYKLQSTPAADETWTGLDGTPGGVNPDLTAPVGAVVKLTAVNGDGVPHNIGIKSGSVLMEPPGFSGLIQAVGSQQTIAWVPTTTGEYTYLCGLHPGTMKGKLIVTAA